MNQDLDELVQIWFILTAFSMLISFIGLTFWYAPMLTPVQKTLTVDQALQLFQSFTQAAFISAAWPAAVIVPLGIKTLIMRWRRTSKEVFA